MKARDSHAVIVTRGRTKQLCDELLASWRSLNALHGMVWCPAMLEHGTGRCISSAWYKVPATLEFAGTAATDHEHTRSATNRVKLYGTRSQKGLCAENG